MVLQGLGSSKKWQPLIEQVNALTPLPIHIQQNPYLPTDTMSFYLVKFSVLSFFTGTHTDYHSPTDIAKKITHWLVNLITKISINNRELPYNKVKHKIRKTQGDFRVSLGTIPNYSQNKKIVGVQLHGVKANSPAEKTGLRVSDIIISLSKIKVENIYDFVYAL